jgi:hypothetical protein
MGLFRVQNSSLTFAADRQERMKINMSCKGRFLWKNLWIICRDFPGGFSFLSLVINGGLLLCGLTP